MSMEDIGKLSNRELASTLKSLGLKSGPITKATRRVFESILRKYYLSSEGNEHADTASDQNSQELNHEQNNSSSHDELFVEELQVTTIKANETETKQPSAYYSICRSVCDSSSEDTSKITPLVCTSLNDALNVMKGIKGARLKIFSTKNEAERFALSLYNETATSETLPTEPIIPYKSPTPQELVIFRKKIEQGNLDDVKSTIYDNPKYIVSSVEVPVILQEGSRYNAMHVAVKSNKLEICKLIIDILNDDNFWRLMFPDNNDASLFERRKIRLLDYYVNSPDKGAGETPLHLACKFGFGAIVQFLVSLPFVERAKINKFDETPIQVICSRLGSSDDACQRKTIIRNYFEASVCVPLWRAEDNSVDPILGDPVQTNIESCRKSSKTTSPVSPLNPKLMVRAYAGPMSPKQATEFTRAWKSPQGQRFRNDFEKGKERYGRELAASRKIPWTEYWSFLGCFTDLKSETGLDRLEQYLKNGIENYQKSHIDIYATPARNKQTLSQTFARPLGSIEGSSKINTKLSFEDAAVNFGGSFEGQMEEDQSQCKKSLFGDFNNKSPTTMGASISSAPSGEEGVTGKIVTRSPEIARDTPASDKLEHMMAGLSLQVTDLAEGNTPTGGSQFQTKSPSVGNSAFDSDASDSMDLSCNSVFYDSPFMNCHSTKQGDELTSEDNSLKHGRFDNPRGAPLFIEGIFPSKLDFDAHRALEDVQLDRTKYPHIYKWMERVNTYSNEDRHRWPSPFSPRYRSKLRHPDAVWSL